MPGDKTVEALKKLGLEEKNKEWVKNAGQDKEEV